MASKPVVVRLPNGAEYGVKDAATAKKQYPQGKVVRYQTGEPYDDPKADTKKDAKK